MIEPKIDPLGSKQPGAPWQGPKKVQTDPEEDPSPGVVFPGH